jgi:hypothetical protein
VEAGHQLAAEQAQLHAHGGVFVLAEAVHLRAQPVRPTSKLYEADRQTDTLNKEIERYREDNTDRGDNESENRTWVESGILYFLLGGLLGFLIGGKRPFGAYPFGNRFFVKISPNL